MANNIDSLREPTRHTSSYGIPSPDFAQLRSLCAQVVKNSFKDFSDSYGNILSLLDVSVDPFAIQALLQFYDPPLRCFTFQDYQLLPTLEEYAGILDIKILNQVPFVQIPV